MDAAFLEKLHGVGVKYGWAELCSNAVAPYHFLPAGRYFVGDPCFFLSDEDWSDFCAQTVSDWHDGIVEVRGFKMAAFRTAYGDGSFAAHHGVGNYIIDVESGIVGAVPEALCSKGRDMGFVIEKGEAIPCHKEGGVVRIGQAAIDTGVDLYDED